MRNRDRRRDHDESFDPIELPPAQLDVDDEAFARAIADGRGEQLAA